eukprot:XP_011447343.1 PREDICTED: complement C1q-like protein 4 [Crassostrea gigas]
MYSLIIINMMRNRYIGVILLAALGLTVSQQLYSREIADDDEVLRIQNQLRRELTAIKGRQVAFFVYMSQNVLINTISKYKTFVYDRVETNVGNGYNVQTGNFTAPESGIYVFHTTTAAVDKSHSTIEIVANDQVKDITWADAMDHNDRAVASSMTVLSLTEGDVVYVRVGLLFAGNYLESNQYTRMSFSGFKLA